MNYIEVTGRDANHLAMCGKAHNVSSCFLRA